MPVLSLLIVSTILASPPGDFRGIPFGAQCSTQRDFAPYAVEHRDTPVEIQVYSQDGDLLKMGMTPVRTISYCCWRDRLIRVHVELDRSAAPMLHAYLSAQWGVPMHMTGGNEYGWLSPGTMATMSWSDPTLPAVLGIFDQALVAEFTDVMIQQPVTGN